MRGLLYKDLYMLFKLCWTSLLVIALFLAVSVSSPMASMMAAYPMLFASMLPVTLIAYDEKDGWDACCCALPVTRGQYVSSKYITGLISSAVVCAAYMAVFSAVSGFNESNFSKGIMYISISMLFSSVNLPCLFSLSYVKDRVVNIILTVLFCAGFGMYSAIINNDMINYRLPWGGVPDIGAAAVMLGAALVIFCTSWLASVAVYKKRQF